MSKLKENTTTTTPRSYGHTGRYAFDKDDSEFYADTCNADNFDQNQIETCSSNNLIMRNNEVTISNDVSIFFV